MVEALAGWLVCPVIKIVVDKASCCASDRIKWLSSDRVSEALGRLGSALIQLRATAGAVERRSSPATSKDLRAWMQQLKDAVYEADDVLDDFDESAPQPESSLVRVSKRILGADEALNRLKEVVKKLEAIHESSQRLMLAAELEASGSGELSGHHSPHDRATGSLRHEEQVVFGRDKELRDMVAWLVGPSDGEAQSVSVPIAVIMGHGGMGKTTLAQLLLQDRTVDSTFDLKIWVRPKPTDDVLELATQILQSAEVDVADNTKSFDCLQKRLKKAVSSRKFLLVIDDVWNREDLGPHLYREMWTKVLGPLRDGSTTGSKIVITSRQDIVATLLLANKKVWLDGLRDDDIWSLLKRSAFGEEDIAKQAPALQDIGRKIAKKLRGSPLAAKAVGQMLEGSRSITQWRKVLDMDIFDNVSSTLKLCYHNLPEHLQPCFAICSIFPKNWKFKRDRLVKIWMALDFIPKAGDETPLEEVGGKYFDQLVARSFFHKQKVGRRRHYYIHDLMHDLAEKVSWFDCVRVEGIKKEIPKTVRHLSVSSDALEMLKSQCELKRLRTLVILNNPSSSLNQLPSDLLSELKGLRVLSLEGCNIVDLSERIGHLKHLRYLALCKTVTMLPQTVTKLYRLQTLRSPKGSCLQGIPKDITNLKCLRHLDMDTSRIVGIGKLVHLQGSVEFHVKNEKGHTLDDLNGMSGLRKELHIKNLEVVTSKQGACQAGLNKKENLKMLELEWNSTDRSVASVAADVLDGLEPHQYIKKLRIRRYPGKRSPNWLNGSLKESNFYLRYLYLINCRKWEVLPPLGQLQYLKVLHMKEMCSVKQISQEFYGNSTTFAHLEELQFDDMPNWVEWTQEKRDTEVFPKLRKLKLSDCPELIKVPPLPLSIRMVSVKNSGFASQLKLFLTSSSKPHRFALDTCSATVLTNGLLHQVQVEAIASLTLRNCQDTKFEKIQALIYLRKLQIHNSDINDEHLGTCLRGLLALNSLEIVNCSNITSLPQIESPDCLTKFYDLHIQYCSEFSSLRALPSFVTLKNLLIENCSKVTAESFPAIFNSTSSLRELKIMNCVQLDSLPSGLPSSLQVLHLTGCKPTLMNQLQLKAGPEWDKVDFIPAKHIH
ncbi:hypothetical protein EJB05_35525, partial [Eragrostis curvula]